MSALWRQRQVLWVRGQPVYQESSRTDREHPGLHKEPLSWKASKWRKNKQKNVNFEDHHTRKLCWRMILEDSWVERQEWRYLWLYISPQAYSFRKRDVSITEDNSSLFLIKSIWVRFVTCQQEYWLTSTIKTRKDWMKTKSTQPPVQWSIQHFRLFRRAISYFYWVINLDSPDFWTSE